MLERSNLLKYLTDMPHLTAVNVIYFPLSFLQVLPRRTDRSVVASGKKYITFNEDGAAH